MCPTEFDKKIKSAFDQREIQPSQSLWDRIESELEQPVAASTPPAETKRPLVLWMIAASFVLLLGVGFVWNSSLVEPANQVITVSSPISVPAIISPLPAIEELALNPAATPAPQLINRSVTVVPKTVAKQEKRESQPQTVELAQRFSIPKEVADSDAVIAQIALSSKAGTPIKVNANKLLQSVDQHSTGTKEPESTNNKEPFFRFLDQKYNQVKYAISNRNYQTN